jgi:hypothetical protein
MQALATPGTSLNHISHDQRCFYELLEQARADNTLTQAQCTQLCKALSKSRKKQELKAYYMRLDQRLPQARRVKMQGPAILGFTKDSENNSCYAAEGCDV